MVNLDPLTLIIRGFTITKLPFPEIERDYSPQYSDLWCGDTAAEAVLPSEFIESLLEQGDLPQRFFALNRDYLRPLPEQRISKQQDFTRHISPS